MTLQEASDNYCKACREFFIVLGRELGITKLVDALNRWLDSKEGK